MKNSELLELPREERQPLFLEKFNSVDRGFGMFSNKGDKRVHKLISKCIKKLFSESAIRKEDYEKYVEAEVKKVGGIKEYEEISDTAVGDSMIYWLRLAVEMSGYDWDYFDPYI